MTKVAEISAYIKANPLSQNSELQDMFSCSLSLVGTARQNVGIKSPHGGGHAGLVNLRNLSANNLMFLKLESQRYSMSMAECLDLIITDARLDQEDGKTNE